MIVEDDKILFLDGYDDCFAGICLRFGQQPIAIYDYQKIIDKLMEDGLDDIDAEEWFNYNIIGAYVGEYTPAFIVKDITPE